MALPVVLGAAAGAFLAGLVGRLLLSLFSGLARFGTVVAIPLLWNMQIDWARAAMDQVGALLAGAGISLEAVQFTGLAAWVMDCLRFGDCLGVVIVTCEVVVIQRLLSR